MRLIDADVLINILFPIARDLADEYGSLGGAVSGTIRHIQAAPTITPESLVRHGRWILKDNHGAVCNQCNRLSRYMGNYCPNCGCKMLEDDDGAE